MSNKANIVKRGMRKSAQAFKPSAEAIRSIKTDRRKADEDRSESLVGSRNEEAALPSTDTRTKRPKASSKLGIVLSLLEKPAGASLGKLVEVTGWLPHTTRAALTSLRKRGFPVVLHAQPKGRSSVYRIPTDAA